MHLYAIALGSNRRHGRFGTPEAIVRAAALSLGGDIRLIALSPLFATAAMGDRGRRFANAAATIETALTPPALLARLKQVERAFGRRRGKRWGARVLDLDILLWSGGRWRSHHPRLTVPHRALAERRFVLDPLVRVAPRWRLAGTARTVAHAHARLTRPSRVP
ncbi:2-amino-4-hydroxy-6-hydroxymethyldihydropteridine diphosphokinase [Sphingomonas sp.]|uniref:2-amino-4-hydroxy-6- hydroxymethyldihydropteridine diphosphokinase n=1 Tax=Sphingomonas sp. TaxID=28214 RepID=UPI000DAF8843|nr:2-amino-4-hydroxy-6-hydroxymethyldihydropteridine diphosphokinase [Sphingomonas sp.]PZU08669.1 MAG: 2-amino-4-hydroxy-6-hydroxymethyldihydropteridine diphosphokinase [Sphingomonas sp.]